MLVVKLELPVKPPVEVPEVGRSEGEGKSGWRVVREETPVPSIVAAEVVAVLGKDHG